jgi:beta-lactamase superfamily II metal-dependent hydrolase
MAGCGNPEEHKAVISKNADNSQMATMPSQDVEAIWESGKLIVHYIDIGQGDAELLQLPNGQNMLIDAGTNAASANLVAYLNRQEIKKIDYLVATHPHEDHIGGMDNVIQGFNIGSIYMPRVTTTTKSFEDVVDSIKAKGLKITPGKAGMTILNEDGLEISFLAPGGTFYEDLNNWSIVTRIQFGNTSFLFTGDAEDLSENEMRRAGANLQADVLKVAHHGSYSSTSVDFLRAVAPRYAVITVAADNDYGHPHQITLNKLVNFGVEVFRTDEKGTVIISSDGNNLLISTVATSIKADNSSVPSSSPGGYIGNKNSRIFHLPDCQSLPQPHNRAIINSREEAISQGYSPCGNCNP